MILLGLLDNFGYSPSLILGKGTGLHHAHAVADVALVVFVMRLQLHRTLDDLFVKGMLYAVLNGDNDGLIHLVADHFTDTSFSQISFHGKFSFHYAFAFSVITV